MRAVGAILLAAALFGTTGTAQALGPGSTTPLGVGAARLVVGELALLAVLPVLGSGRGEAVALWRTLSGVVAGGCTRPYQVCFFAGGDRPGGAVGARLANGSGPVLTGVFARWLLHGPPGRTWYAATGFCLAGLVLLVLGRGGSGGGDLAGVALAALAGLSYATYTVLAKKQLNAGHRPSAVMAG